MLERHLQQAANIVRRFAETGIETMKLIAEAPDPSTATSDLFAKSDAVLAVYPDTTEYGGYGIVVAKESEPKDLNCVTCLYCHDRFHAVELLCAHGDLQAEVALGSARMYSAGATEDEVMAVFKDAVAHACEHHQSYVETLAARLQLAESTTASITRH